MNTKMSEITKIIGVRIATVIHFCEDFKIDLKAQIINDKYIRGESEIESKFVDYLKEQREILLKYEKDYYLDKTPLIISRLISKDIKDVENYLKKFHPIYYKNEKFNTSMRYPLRYVSSYKVDFDLGGDYNHLKFNPESNSIIGINILIENQLDKEIQIIGYDDILNNIIEQVEPILYPNENEEWGLNKPGGILLFGPPGCGKTMWARKISHIIKYGFEEIPRSIFGSIYVDGAMTNLKKKIDEYENKFNCILFFDEFDSVATIRNNSSSSSFESSKVVNTLLQEIPKLIKNNNLIIGATNFLNILDPAVIRPGRFDLKIPVFPPNQKEKSQLIYHNLVVGLNEKSPLLKILKFNKAENYEYWISYASKMILFSTSLVIDFTQLLKRRLKNTFRETQSFEFILEENYLSGIINEVSSKITQNDAKAYNDFFDEVTGLNSDFYSERLYYLSEELKIYFDKNKKTRRIIGY